MVLSKNIVIATSHSYCDDEKTKFIYHPHSIIQKLGLVNLVYNETRFI